MKISPKCRAKALVSTVLLATLVSPWGHARAENDLAAIIKAPQTAVLSSQVDGLVREVKVRDGDTFKKDDELIVFDCTVQTANFGKAKAQYNYASQDYKSMKALAKLNSASEMQIAQSKTAYSSAGADLTTAKYQVSQCVVTAPYDGSVIQSWVNTYENVQAKSKLLEIINNNDLTAEFLAPSHMLNQLGAGRLFSVRVNETQQSYPAVIDRIVPQVDAVSQTIKVIGRLQSSHPDLWSGMSGWVDISPNE